MLTNTQCNRARAQTRPYKLFDGAGLYLLVQPNGSRLWRWQYRRNGKQNTLSMGPYPEVGLKLARDKRDTASKQLASGADPSAVRKTERAALATTFQLVAEQWLKERGAKLTKVTQDKAHWLLREFVFPHVGNKPVHDITPADVLRVLRRIEAKGLNETARRCRQKMSAVFRFAVATHRCTFDPTSSLERDALAPVKVKHRAAITEPKAVGALLRALDTYQGQPSVMYSLRLAPRLFVRPGELRSMEWSELDLDGKEPTWRIPAHKTKMRREHLVPLSLQAVELLTELRDLTHYSKFAFPSLRTRERCMSEVALTAALARLGYSGSEHTPHGFRTTASTLLHELGYDSRLVELQLAHKDRDKVRDAYNRSERLPDRRKLMQSWSDYLDGLKADTGDKVVQLKRERA